MSHQALYRKFQVLVIPLRYIQINLYLARGKALQYLTLQQRIKIITEKFILDLYDEAGVY